MTNQQQLRACLLANKQAGRGSTGKGLVVGAYKQMIGARRLAEKNFKRQQFMNLLPTYAAVSSIPYLTYLLRDKINAFSTPKKAFAGGSNESWGKTLGAFAGTAAGMSLLTKAYAGMMPAHIDKADELQRSNAERGRKAIEDEGYSIENQHPGFFGLGRESLEPYDSGVNPWNNTAYLADNAAPSIISHELGHVRGSRLLAMARVPAMLTAGLFGAKALLNQTNRATSKRDALISGGALALGLLPSEMDASVKGYNFLSDAEPEQRLPFSQRAKNFVGLPTYAAIAAAPILTYALRNKFNAFNDKPV